MDKHTKHTLMKYLPTINSELKHFNANLSIEEELLTFQIDGKLSTLKQSEDEPYIFKSDNGIELALYINLDIKQRYQNKGYKISFSKNAEVIYLSRLAGNHFFPEKGIFIETYENEVLKEQLYFYSNSEGYYFSLQDENKLDSLSYEFNEECEKKGILTTTDTIIDHELLFHTNLANESTIETETTLKDPQVQEFLRRYIKKGLETTPEWLIFCSNNTHQPEMLEEIYNSIGLDIKNSRMLIRDVNQKNTQK